MIQMNAPTSFAYIQLRKYHYHYTMLARELNDCVSPGDVIKSYARDCNDRKNKKLNDPFPDFDSIDFQLIADFWDVNLPLNNPKKLADYGVKAARYTAFTNGTVSKAA